MTYILNKGFTLIELLIVVLIIAILAAIAVPNFLEFQTRAKVARVHSDMRTLVTAIEAYIVESEREPIGWYEGIFVVPRWPDNPIKCDPFYQLTTPIAYLSTVAQDPFAVDTSGHLILTAANGPCYHYETIVPAFNVPIAEQMGLIWYLRTLGPYLRVPPAPIFVEQFINQRNVNGFYDPTNGTVSVGYIVRSNRGIEPVGF